MSAHLSLLGVKRTSARDYRTIAIYEYAPSSALRLTVVASMWGKSMRGDGSIGYSPFLHFPRLHALKPKELDESRH